MTFINKLICLIVIPLFTLQYSPLFLVAKLFNEPTEPTSISEGNLENVKLVAHRGGTTEAPENSLPAFRSAIEKNYYAAECDIIRTKDGRWVISHDDEAFKHFFSFGKISEMTFDEARELKYSFDTNFWLYQDEKIPTLEEYLDLFVGKSTRAMIELKTDTLEGLEDVVKAIDERNLNENVIIISFYIESLRKVAKLNPQLEMWYLVRGIDDENIAEAKSLPNCTGISADNGFNDADSIKLAIDNGFDVAIWTIDSVKKAEKFNDMGAEYIVTNKLGY